MAALTYPLFLSLWVLLQILALFKKDTEWKPIRHGSTWKEKHKRGQSSFNNLNWRFFLRLSRQVLAVPILFSSRSLYVSVIKFRNGCLRTVTDTDFLCLLVHVVCEFMWHEGYHFRISDFFCTCVFARPWAVVVFFSVYNKKLFRPIVFPSKSVFFLQFLSNQNSWQHILRVFLPFKHFRSYHRRICY